MVLPFGHRISFDVLHCEIHSYDTKISVFLWMGRSPQTSCLLQPKLCHYYLEFRALTRIESMHGLVCQWYRRRYHHVWANPPKMECKVYETQNRIQRLRLIKPSGFSKNAWEIIFSHNLILSKRLFRSSSNRSWLNDDFQVKCIDNFDNKSKKQH